MNAMEKSSVNYQGLEYNATQIANAVAARITLRGKEAKYGGDEFYHFYLTEFAGNEYFYRNNETGLTFTPQQMEQMARDNYADGIVVVLDRPASEIERLDLDTRCKALEGFDSYADYCRWLFDSELPDEYWYTVTIPLDRKWWE